MPFDQKFLANFLNTLAYVLMGLATFALSFWVITKVTPFSIRKEIEEDQNISLAILIASVFLGTAYIIAAAIHG
jgi:putative membrane protein